MSTHSQFSFSTIACALLLSVSNVGAHVTDQDRARTDLRDIREPLMTAAQTGNIAPVKKVIKRDVQVIWLGGAMRQGHQAAEDFIQELNATGENSSESGSPDSASTLLENLEIAEDGKSGAFFGTRPTDQRRWTATVSKNPNTGKWEIDSFILDASADDFQSTSSQQGWIWWTTLLVVLALAGCVAGIVLWQQKSRPQYPYPNSLSKNRR